MRINVPKTRPLSQISIFPPKIRINSKNLSVPCEHSGSQSRYINQYIKKLFQIFLLGFPITTVDWPKPKPKPKQINANIITIDAFKSRTESINLQLLYITIIDYLNIKPNLCDRYVTY